MTVHYPYTRVTFKGDKSTRSSFVLSSERLEREMGATGRLAFMMLINKWNRIGLLGVPNGGPVYVYMADELGS